MRRRLWTSILVVAGLVFLASPLFAHHGTGISYDLTKAPITAKAIVTEYKWANPHIQIFVDVKDDKGKVEACPSKAIVLTTGPGWVGIERL